MIKRLKYIIPAFILLSLTALGDNIIIPNTCIKYIKETEWVSNTNSVKILKCFNYTQYSYEAENDFSIHIRSSEYVEYYHRAVSVKIITLAKILYQVSFKNRQFITLNIPGKFFEEALSSINQSYGIPNGCLTCPAGHEKNSMMCKSLINRKWINQQLKTFGYSKELNEFQFG